MWIYMKKKSVDTYAHVLLRLLSYIPKATHPIFICFTKEKMKFRSDTRLTWGFPTNRRWSCDLSLFQLTKWGYLHFTSCFLQSSSSGPLCMKLKQEGRVSNLSSRIPISREYVSLTISWVGREPEYMMGCHAYCYVILCGKGILLMQLKSLIS